MNSVGGDYAATGKGLYQKTRPTNPRLLFKRWRGYAPLTVGYPFQFGEFEQFIKDYQDDLLDWWKNPGGKQE